MIIDANELRGLADAGRERRRSVVTDREVARSPAVTVEGEGKAELLAKLGFVATSASLPREAPRLCRGGSRSLTFTAVAQRTNSRTVTGAQRKISGE